MTKIKAGKPVANAAAAVAALAPRNKKRSFSTTLHGRIPLHSNNFNGNGRNNNSLRYPYPPIKGKGGARKRAAEKAPAPLSLPPHQHHQPILPAGGGGGHQQHQHHQMDMRSILQRYHALATTHYHATKKRRLESSARAAQNIKRLEQLEKLHQMAQDTLEFCEGVLRSEEGVRMETELERRDVEVELRKAEQEKKLAEEFLNKHGIRSDCRGRGEGEGSMMMTNDDDGGAENIENQEGGEHKIGGIPSKFLDLSHFPGLQKKKSFEAGSSLKRDSSIFSPESDGSKCAIIDCTEESPRWKSSRHFDNGIAVSDRKEPMRIPSFGMPLGVPEGIPQEVALGGHNYSNKAQKQNTKRVYISHASLSHVNGTYIQEGNYNGAPLFVRVGPPRKFMGKWDCSVVLRREKNNSEKAGRKRPPISGNFKKRGDKSKGAGGKCEYVWKIGLVPAHRITHPRIICYFVTNESDSHVAVPLTTKRVSTLDCMDEDLDEDKTSCFEPPVEGWRVFQPEAGLAIGVGGIANHSGRASGLKVSYEE